MLMVKLNILKLLVGHLADGFHKLYKEKKQLENRVKHLE